MLEGKKIIYDKVDLLLKVGNKADSFTKALKKGTCLGVKLVHISSTTPVNHALNINVGDGNNTILGASDFRDFIPLGGGYFEGFKPCKFDSSLEITVDLLAEEVIATNDFKGQLVFLIEAQD